MLAPKASPSAMNCYSNRIIVTIRAAAITVLQQSCAARSAATYLCGEVFPFVWWMNCNAVRLGGSGQRSRWTEGGDCGGQIGQARRDCRTPARARRWCVPAYWHDSVEDHARGNSAPHRVSATRCLCRSLPSKTRHHHERPARETRAGEPSRMGGDSRPIRSQWRHHAGGRSAVCLAPSAGNHLRR